MIDTRAIKARINLPNYVAGRGIVLAPVSGREWGGPCPKCGGTDRFRVKDDGFFCRQCRSVEDHGWGDAIDFVMWLDGVDFKEATEALGGSISAPVRRPDVNTGTIVPKADERPVKDFSGRVERAHERLFGRSPEGLSAWLYLNGERGIERGTAKDFRLGVECWSEDGVGITMPWYAQDGTIPAVRVRLVRPVGDKVKSAKGSTTRGVVFGLQNVRGKKNLLLVEGEINAMSVYQVCGTWIDVLSVGAQSSIIPQFVIDLSRRYRNVGVWFDEEKQAAAAQLAMGGSFRIRSKPDGAPEKRDANDLLRLGLLGRFLDLAFPEIEEG